MMLPTATDEALIASAQRGDRSAFALLVCRHQAGVIGVIARMCGDSALAEDAAQEAFVRVWQRLDRYRPGGSFRAWLYRIAMNAALDALRRGERRPAWSLDGAGADGGEPVDPPDPRDGPEQALETRERDERVRRAVRSLPEASRAVLVLREYAGMSYAEIGAALDIPLGTVMSRLNFARGLLRRSLADWMEEV